MESLEAPKPLKVGTSALTLQTLCLAVPSEDANGACFSLGVADELPDWNRKASPLKFHGVTMAHRERQTWSLTGSKSSQSQETETQNNTKSSQKYAEHPMERENGFEDNSQLQESLQLLAQDVKGKISVEMLRNRKKCLKTSTHK